MDGRLREALIFSIFERRLVRLAFPLLLSMAWTTGSGRLVLAEESLQESEHEAAKLRVFAAASLTEIVERLASRFETGRVVASFGSSAALARQIVDGAPADVFFSASPQWTEQLFSAGLVAGEEVSIARNLIVCVAPRGTALDASGPAELLSKLGEGARVAIADAGVPAGEYARASLADVDLLGAYRSRLVGLKDVRAVLHAVERGEVDAGFVYATDAQVGDVALLFVLDGATYPAVEYRAVVLRTGAEPIVAASFVRFVRGEKGRAVLAAAGFAPPPAASETE